ncbi:hypothetical protein CJ030_MR0G013669 [Morella rubra]|uniref:Uncharacterized protein n=1 Tax=Morella rubra TaxID=262757 RepID=A0A6A1UJ03_9ROSI|nr:hypothetical protein CJ030_MR0G013669 [Morella rubra]
MDGNSVKRSLGFVMIFMLILLDLLVVAQAVDDIPQPPSSDLHPSPFSLRRRLCSWRERKPVYPKTLAKGIPNGKFCNINSDQYSLTFDVVIGLIGFKEGRSSSPAIDCQKGSEGILGPAPIQAINKKADLGHVQPHLTITNAGERYLLWKVFSVVYYA